jgi:hypothetical protein
MSRLAVQRQVVRILGAQQRGEQAGGRDAFVDDLGRHRRLQQCSAVSVRPFTTGAALDGEDATDVVELLADVLTDAPEHAAAHAGGSRAQDGVRCAASSSGSSSAAMSASTARRTAPFAPR